MTFKQLSAEVTGSIGLLESRGPPRESAGWHEAFLSLQKAQVKELEEHAGAGDGLVSDAFLLDVLLPPTV